MCKKCGLDNDDMELLTIGMCLDFMAEYIEQQKPDKEKIRRASQSDYDAF